MREPIIIAEAGINHNGEFDKAIKLIKVARECKADFVKFHAAYADRIIQKKKFNKLWRNKHSKNEPFSDFIKKVEFSAIQFKELFDFSKKLGIKFMVTPYDLPALEQMLSLGIRDIKIASCDIIKDDYIKLATKEADLLVISTGMASEDEIKHAINLIDPQKTYILHCVSEYPALAIHSNLLYITHLKKTYGLRVGFSDHTDDIIIPLLAVAKGAVMIEKHFMLENSSDCPDYEVSITKNKFAKLVYYAKHIDEIMGTGIKLMTEQEVNNREKFRYRWK